MNARGCVSVSEGVKSNSPLVPAKARYHMTRLRIAHCLTKGHKKKNTFSIIDKNKYLYPIFKRVEESGRENAKRKRKYTKIKIRAYSYISHHYKNTNTHTLFFFE
jgi:hypothetical protein